MNLERLLPFLRCISCGGNLRHDDERLICPGCGQSFPLINTIPVLLQTDNEEKVWEDYFRELSKKRGDTAAANSYFSPKNFNFVRENLSRLIGEVKNLAILDVGCGTGHFSQSLVKDNLVVGVDISLEMLTWAQRKGLSAVQSSGKRLPFEKESFELVIANNVIQSLKEGRLFIHELARVTKPGARIIVSSTNGENFALGFFKIIEKRKYRHLRVYTAEEIRQFFLSAGCQVESFLFLHFPFGKVRRVRGEEILHFFNRHLATTFAIEAVKPQDYRDE
jgi:ubiquinone/menaquinone biosynthesis C-methylase UbiE